VPLAPDPAGSCPKAGSFGYDYAGGAEGALRLCALVARHEVRPGLEPSARLSTWLLGYHAGSRRGAVKDRPVRHLCADIRGSHRYQPGYATPPGSPPVIVAQLVRESLWDWIPVAVLARVAAAIAATAV